MDINAQFGSIMQRSRLDKGITQEVLAESVGISVNYCRDIEHGKYTPTWIIWLKICTVLEVDIWEFQDTYIREVLDESTQYLGLK